MQSSTFFIVCLVAALALVCSAKRGFGGQRPGQVPSSCDELVVPCDGDTECVEVTLAKKVRAVCVPQGRLPSPSCDELDCENLTCLVRKRGKTLVAACVATSCDQLECENDTVCVVRNKGAITKPVCISERAANRLMCFECAKECALQRSRPRGIPRGLIMNARIFARCLRTQQCDCDTEV